MKMSKRSGIGSLLLGGAIGAGIALLFAPKKGEELRKDLLEKISELCDKLKDIDEDEVKANIEKKVKEIKKVMTQNFPNWKENIYFKKSSIKYKVTAFLVMNNMKLGIRILDIIRGK